MGKKSKASSVVRDVDEHGDRSIPEDQRSSQPEASSKAPQEASEGRQEVDLGLDISSSCTGVVVMNKKGNLQYMGHITLTSTKYKNLFDKADAVLEWLKTNVPSDKFDITRIFVEANAKMFTPGFSSADTLITLAKMNALVSYLSKNYYGTQVLDINVASARKMIGWKNVKAIKKPVKEKVREFVLLNNPNLPFETRLVTKGKDLGKMVPVAGAEDEVDAFVVCRGGQLLHPWSKPPL